MSGYTVTTPFNTPTRRFAVGQSVTEADLDGSLTLKDRVQLGHITAPKPTKAAKAPPADQADPTA